MSASNQTHRGIHRRASTELTLNGVCRLAGQVMARLAMLGDKLRNLAADLNRLDEEVHSLAANLKTAAPRLSDCGGARRLLLVAPDGVASRLQARIDVAWSPSLHASR